MIPVKNQRFSVKTLTNCGKCFKSNRCARCLDMEIWGRWIVNHPEKYWMWKEKEFKA